jgi:hypothetical protein
VSNDEVVVVMDMAVIQFRRVAIKELISGPISGEVASAAE